MITGLDQMKVIIICLVMRINGTVRAASFNKTLTAFPLKKLSRHISL